MRITTSPPALLASKVKVPCAGFPALSLKKCNNYDNKIRENSDKRPGKQRQTAGKTATNGRENSDKRPGKQRQQAWSSEDFSLLYYRDSDNKEVDLILEFIDSRVIAIEIKATSSVWGVVG
jgi:hypothetical protein